MYSLDQSTIVTAVLDAASTTAAPTYTVTYSDVALAGGVVTARQPYATATGAMTGTTAVTIVASPSTGYAREIENIAFRNKDTVSHTVTLGGAVDLSFVVPAGQILSYDGHSWRLGVDNTVQMAGDVSGASSSNTIGKIGGYSVTLTGTVTLSGGYSFAATLTGNTAVTFPTSGALATTDTAQTISGAKTYTTQLVISGTGQTTANLADSGNTGGTVKLASTDGLVGSGGAVIFCAFSTKIIAAIKAYFTDGTANGVGDLTFSTRNSASDTALTERIRLFSNGSISIGSLNYTEKLTVAGNICHAADNAYSFGTATYRASAVYAVTGSILTSWSKQKANVRKMSEAEQACFLEIGGNACVYQWIDAVAAKGADKARLHVGYIADDDVTFDAVLSVKAICEKHGIDFDRWGFGCKDPNKITVTKTRAVTQQKTAKKTRTVEVIATTSDGTQTVTYTDETYDDPVWVTDESGADVWFDLLDASGAVLKSADGTVRQYRKPVYETTEETNTEDDVETDAEGRPVYRYGLRYTELREAIAAAEHKALAALTARVAALEAKAT